MNEELKNARELIRDPGRMNPASQACFVHEIRTPLNGIAGFAGLLTDPEITEEEKQKFITIINKNALSTIRVLNEWLEFYHHENDNGETSANLEKQPHFVDNHRH